MLIDFHALAPIALFGKANKTFCRTLLINCLLITPALSDQSSANLNLETSVGVPNSAPLLLSDAINTALHNDPWLAGNLQQQKALKAKAIASAALPNPKISLALANLATDSLEFKQENMSQLKLSASQMLPRGNSQSLKKIKFTQMGEALPHQHHNRRAQLSLQVSQSWLDTYKAQESLALIVENRPLFEQLIDIAQSKYTSAVGKTRQQDVVRAQLELTRLDDRAARLRQQQEVGLATLSQWISDEESIGLRTHKGAKAKAFIHHLDRQLPKLDPPSISTTDTSAVLLTHPAVLAIDKHINASQTDISLAEQHYKPQFGINAAYAYRDDAPNGMERTDFFSVGLGFDLPLFTGKKQDQEVKAAAANAESIKTRKWLLLRELYAGFDAADTQLLRLNERQHLYKSRLLPQMHEQSEASLNAYTNDVGDFAEVMRSRIAELNAHIDHLSINVDRQKTIAKLNYFFAGGKRLPTGDRYE